MDGQTPGQTVDVERTLRELAERQVATNDLLVTLVRQVMSLQTVVDQLSRLQDGLLVDVRSAKAAAVDAGLRSSNASMDLERAVEAVDRLGSRVDALERTVRSLKIYKSVLPSN